MSFKFYKFCQNGLITAISSVFSMYYNLSISGTIVWWLGLLIALATTVIAFIPPLGMFYPITFGIYMLIALVRSFSRSAIYFWILLIVLLLHIIRFVAMLTFARSNPEKSLQYDEAIRYGFNPDKA